MLIKFYNFLQDTIGAYTFVVAVGAVVSFFVYAYLARKRGRDWPELFSFFIIELVGMFLGAHLLYFFVQLPEWIEYYSGRIQSVGDFFVAFTQGASGLVFYGGLLGATLCVYLYSRRHRYPVRSELNNAVIVYPLFHMFGRIGCTLNGCCYGIEYHGIFAIQYTSDYIVAGKSDDVADYSRFPIQPLEALVGLIMFIILFILYKKTKDKYSLTCIYFLVYSIIRFFDEFLRGDAARGIWGPFSTSQWISLAIFVVTVTYLIVLRKKNRKQAL